MKKRDKIIYWIATLWLSLGMFSTGLVQLLQLKDGATMFNHLGYPLYLAPILGVWKMLGVMTILMPRLPLVKEWAYAGFFFAMTGAVISHAAVGDSAKEFFGPVLLIVLTVVSWYFRPVERRLVPANS
jgi:hypothetical protein